MNLMFEFVLVLSVAPSIIGVDIGSNYFRVALANSSKSFFFLPSSENPAYFSTILSIKSDVADSPDLFSPEELLNKSYVWLDSQSPPKFPSSTIYHASNFLGKSPNIAFAKLCRARKFMTRLTVSNESSSRIITAGIPPEAIMATTFQRIKDKACEFPINISQTLLVVPKFWIQSQTETIFYPSKKLGLNPYIIDSSVAMASFIAFKCRQLIRASPLRILSINMGASSFQLSVMEFVHKNVTYVREASYLWEDSLGGRDFDAVISSLIKKQTKGQADPNSETFRMVEAERAKIALSSNETVEGEADGCAYKIDRKTVEAAASALICRFKEAIGTVNTKNIDRVVVSGGGVLFFPLIPIVKSIFGSARLIVPEEIFTAMSIGAAWLPSMKVVVESMQIYDVTVTQGSFKSVFREGMKLMSGPIRLSIENCAIPVGCHPVFLIGVAKPQTKIEKNSLYKLIDPQAKPDNSWRETAMRTFQALSRRVEHQEMVDYALKVFSDELSAFTDELENSELLDEVMTTSERESVEDYTKYFTKWLHANRNTSDLQSLTRVITRFRECILPSIMKQNQKIFFQSTVQRLEVEIESIEDRIKKMREMVLKEPVSSIEYYMGLIAEMRIWLKGPLSLQLKADPKAVPKIWYFDVNTRTDELSREFQSLFSKIESDDKRSDI